eukprot:TRINITY_DN13542_c0_g1_i1.p1 TRINITY_DN13542_c0_g1~~TRINITY_DN13542_c0_g1_i1.p1  ORF type:complete len:225 (+),score=30.51 TRINITY_DN13542_c0_g1_i1:25-675(+)
MAELVRIQTTYDTIAKIYDAKISGELASKPLDRALLDAFSEFVKHGLVCDLGCGPGHISAYLAAKGVATHGIDLSSSMIDCARSRYPELSFATGSMTALSERDSAWAGAILFYSIIHLTQTLRVAAFRELARVVCNGGYILLAFHVSSADHAVGSINHLDTWWEQRVDVDGYFIDPTVVTSELQSVGFVIQAKLEREPIADVEYPSKRCYILAKRT